MKSFKVGLALATFILIGMQVKASEVLTNKFDEDVGRVFTPTTYIKLNQNYTLPMDAEIGTAITPQYSITTWDGNDLSLNFRWQKQTASQWELSVSSQDEEVDIRKEINKESGLTIPTYNLLIEFQNIGSFYGTEGQFVCSHMAPLYFDGEAFTELPPLFIIYEDTLQPITLNLGGVSEGASLFCMKDQFHDTGINHDGKSIGD